MCASVSSKYGILWGIVILLLFHQSACSSESKLTLHEDYQVAWSVHNESVVFELSVATKGFIGFGISTNGGMEGADIVIAGVHLNGTPYLQDYHGVGKVEPVLDKSQDYRLISASENETHTNVKFSRLLNTCDQNGEDVPITDDTLKLIWAVGLSDTLEYHGARRGSRSINLLDPQSQFPDLSQYKTWRVSHEMELGEDDTTYWCTFYKAPVLSKKHHIVGFNIYLDGPLALKHTHHADLYKCTTPPGKDPNEYFGKYVGGKGYDCYFDPEFFPVKDCLQFEFQWTIGGNVTMFPEHVGMPIGEDPHVYYMTEIHFDNPQKENGTTFTSGMDFYYTDHLRQYDAGFLQIGVMSQKTYSLTIPPNSQDFVVSSHCPAELTSALPEEGVNAFVFLLHSHLSGRKMTVRQFRNGTEQPWLAHDHNYDFNYQSNRLLREEVKIMPGDHITLECNYDTRWKNGLSTLGGRSPREEMCQTFIMYYPRTEDINQCGSYFKQSQMLEYMGILNATLEEGEIDPTVWEPESLRGKKYSEIVEKGIDWTPKRREEFKQMVRFFPQETYRYPPFRNGTEFMSAYPAFQEYVPKLECHSGSSISSPVYRLLICVSLLYQLISKY